ncbi:transposase family protein [Embleya sp. NPDC001921]
MRVEARCTTAGASCPACGTWSDRVHGSYLRFPADVPCGGRRLVLRLRVRRFARRPRPHPPAAPRRPAPPCPTAALRCRRRPRPGVGWGPTRRVPCAAPRRGCSSRRVAGRSIVAGRRASGARPGALCLYRVALTPAQPAPPRAARSAPSPSPAGPSVDFPAPAISSAAPLPPRAAPLPPRPAPCRAAAVRRCAVFGADAASTPAVDSVNGWRVPSCAGNAPHWTRQARSASPAHRRHRSWDRRPGPAGSVVDPDGGPIPWPDARIPRCGPGPAFAGLDAAHLGLWSVEREPARRRDTTPCRTPPTLILTPIRPAKPSTPDRTVRVSVWCGWTSPCGAGPVHARPTTPWTSRRCSRPSWTPTPTAG